MTFGADDVQATERDDLLVLGELAAAGALRLDRVPGLLPGSRLAITFALTCFAWIFFRANTLDDALVVAGVVPGMLLALIAWWRLPPPTCPLPARR